MIVIITHYILCKTVKKTKPALFQGLGRPPAKSCVKYNNIFIIKVLV